MSLRKKSKTRGRKEILCAAGGNASGAAGLELPYKSTQQEQRVRNGAINTSTDKMINQQRPAAGLSVNLHTAHKQATEIHQRYAGAGQIKQSDAWDLGSPLGGISRYASIEMRGKHDDCWKGSIPAAASWLDERGSRGIDN